MRVLRPASDDHGEVAALTSHDFRLGLMADRWDYTYCPECGDLTHRGDMDGEMCAVCAAYQEDE